eukprot:Filipodium_phascolosomae@DN2574_c0_g1_i1.p1
MAPLKRAKAECDSEKCTGDRDRCVAATSAEEARTQCQSCLGTCNAVDRNVLVEAATVLLDCQNIMSCVGEIEICRNTGKCADCARKCSYRGLKDECNDEERAFFQRASSAQCFELHNRCKATHSGVTCQDCAVQCAGDLGKKADCNCWGHSASCEAETDDTLALPKCTACVDSCSKYDDQRQKCQEKINDINNRRNACADAAGACATTALSLDERLKGCETCQLTCVGDKQPEKEGCEKLADELGVIVAKCNAQHDKCKAHMQTVLNVDQDPQNEQLIIDIMDSCAGCTRSCGGVNLGHIQECGSWERQFIHRHAQTLATIIANRFHNCRADPQRINECVNAKGDYDEIVRICDRCKECGADEREPCETKKAQAKEQGVKCYRAHQKCTQENDCPGCITECQDEPKKMNECQAASAQPKFPPAGGPMFGQMPGMAPHMMPGMMPMMPGMMPPGMAGAPPMGMPQQPVQPHAAAQAMQPPPPPLDLPAGCKSDEQILPSLPEGYSITCREMQTQINDALHTVNAIRKCDTLGKNEQQSQQKKSWGSRKPILCRGIRNDQCVEKAPITTGIGTSGEIWNFEMLDALSGVKNSAKKSGSQKAVCTATLTPNTAGCPVPSPTGNGYSECTAWMDKAWMKGYKNPRCDPHQCVCCWGTCESTPQKAVCKEAGKWPGTTDGDVDKRFKIHQSSEAYLCPSGNTYNKLCRPVGEGAPPPPSVAPQNEATDVKAPSAGYRTCAAKLALAGSLLVPFLS